MKHTGRGAAGVGPLAFGLIGALLAGAAVAFPLLGYAAAAVGAVATFWAWRSSRVLRIRLRPDDFEHDGNGWQYVIPARTARGRQRVSAFEPSGVGQQMVLLDVSVGADGSLLIGVGAPFAVVLLVS